MKRTPTPADYRSYMEAYGLAIEDFQDVELRSYKRGEYLPHGGTAFFGGGQGKGVRHWSGG